MDKQYHTIKPDGTQEGPFSHQVVNDRYRNGGYPAGTRIWYEGAEGWQAIESVFGPPAAAPVPVPPPPATMPPPPPPPAGYSNEAATSTPPANGQCAAKDDVVGATGQPLFKVKVGAIAGAVAGLLIGIVYVYLGNLCLDAFASSLSDTPEDEGTRNIIDGFIWVHYVSVLFFALAAAGGGAAAAYLRMEKQAKRKACIACALSGFVFGMLYGKLMFSVFLSVVEQYAVKPVSELEPGWSALFYSGITFATFCSIAGLLVGFVLHRMSNKG